MLNGWLNQIIFRDLFFGFCCFTIAASRKVRKNVVGMFKDIGFSLETETNLEEVDFLYLSFNLGNVTYRPYKKTRQ